MNAPRFKLALSLAAVAAAMVVAVILWTPHGSDMHYVTLRGQHSTVTLQDSTIVTLNHTSELTVVKTSDGSRRVLLRGEAFFDVRRNGRPFDVTTDVGTIRVLGTEFNVQARDGRLEVAVLRGTVRVGAERRGRDSAVVLTAGEITSCTSRTFPRPPESILFAGYPGWMHGKFMFFKTTLAAACREIESQCNVTIHVESSHHEIITGVVDGSSAASALATLARVSGTKYRYENGVYFLY